MTGVYVIAAFAAGYIAHRWAVKVVGKLAWRSSSRIGVDARRKVYSSLTWEELQQVRAELVREIDKRKAPEVAA